MTVVADTGRSPSDWVRIRQSDEVNLVVAEIEPRARISKVRPMVIENQAEHPTIEREGTFEVENQNAGVVKTGYERW